MKYHLVHTLKIPAADYYKVITSPEYDQWSKEKLKMESRVVLEEEDTPYKLHRKVKMVTGPVSEKTRAWIKQDRLEIVEIFDVDKQAGTFVWIIEPGIWKDKVKGGGTGKITPAGHESCTRVLDLEVKISIPIIGGMIEKALDKKISEYFEKVNAGLEEFYLTRWKKTQA
jgi:hypothetical protein